MTRVVLVGAVLIGAALRLIPVGYGLPFIYHPDETHLLSDFGKFLESASRGAPTIGASTFYYPLALVYAAYFVYGRAAGHFASVADFKTAFVLDDPTLHLIGRLFSVACSVGSLVAVYAVGLRLHGHRAGAIAAALMAISVVDIAGSHWLKFDSAVVFMSLISLLAILRLQDDVSSRRLHIAAGVTVGLAVAGRIDLLVLVPLLVVAHVIFTGPSTLGDAVRAAVDRSVLTALGVAAMVYLVVSFTLVDAVLKYVIGAPPLFTTREMGASLIQFLLAGDVLMSLQHNIPFYASTVFLGGCGVALTAAIALAVLHRLRWLRAEDAVLFVFLGLLIVPTLLFNVYGTHYFLRVLPLLMVVTAGGLLWLSSRFEGVAGRHAWIVLLAVVIAEPARRSVEYVGYLRTNADTRTRAREWLHRAVPFGETIAVQKFHELPAYLPPLNESPDHVERKLAAVRASGVSSGIAFAARLRQPPYDAYRIVNVSGQSYWAEAGRDLENLYDFEALKTSGATHLVTSGFNTLLPINDDGSPIGILLADQAIDRAAVARYEAFNTRLRHEASLVAEFTAHNARIARLTDAPIDPTVRIYRLQ